jgi:DNA-binding CsgD family transcriptional regulator
MTAVSTAEWPLVGRGAELAAARDVLARRRGGVVIAGAAGVGKTRLASECFGLAAHLGLVPLRVTASVATASIPFGALAPVVPPSATAGREPAELLRRVGQAVADHGGDRPTLLVVDDAHWLDSASASVLNQTVVAGGAVVAVTIRTDEPAPDPVVALWKDGHCQRLDLGPLADDDVAELLTEALAGPVEPASRARLAAASGGNALALRELVLGTVEAGMLAEEGGLWRLVGPLTASARLVELVEGRLAGLPDGARDALELVALGEPIGLGLLEQVVEPAGVETLDRRGLISVTPNQNRLEVRLAHPLHGEVVRAGLGVLQKRSACRRLAAAVQDAGARRRDDILRVAAWCLEAGTPGGADVLLGAARTAATLFDYPLVERLAGAAVNAGAGSDAQMLLADAMAWQGRPADAAAVLDAVEVPDDDEFRRTLLAIAVANNLFWALGRAEDADAVLDAAALSVRSEEAKAGLSAIRAGYDLGRGRLDDAAARAEPLVGHPLPMLSASASAVVAGAEVLRGHYERAKEVARTGFEAHAAIGDMPFLFDVEMHVVLYALALTLSGELREAAAVVTEAYDAMAARGGARMQAWFATLRGMIELFAGDAASALVYAREGSVVLAGGGQPQQAGLARAIGASAAAQIGDLATSRALLADISSSDRAMWGMFAPEVGRASAADLLVRGRRNEAVARLEAAAAEAGAMSAGSMEALCRYDLARLAGAAPQQERFAELADEVDGPAVQVMRDAVVAMAASDAAALDDVAQRFAELGYRAWASEAAAQAAGWFAEGGQERRAAAARRHAATDVPALSDRERDVARRAAAGATSRDIAEELYLSVRTVDNHLRRVYDKLGVSGRAELADALDAIE